MLEKPSKLVQIHIVPNPPVPYISPNQGFEGVSQNEAKIRYLKAKEVGDFGNVREVDLRMSAIDSGNRNGDAASGTNGENSDIAPGMSPYVRPMQYSERYPTANTTFVLIEYLIALVACVSTICINIVADFSFLSRMVQRNNNRIRQQLEDSLEAVQLMDYDVKMRIQYVNSPSPPYLLTALGLCI